MELTLARLFDTGDATGGVLYIDEAFECFTLEDEHRKQKVAGETRIPEGIYELGVREVLSNMTKKYRERRSLRDLFDWHLHVKNVPNFEYVYIHIGNDDDDTEGCILVGGTLTADGFLGNSTEYYKNLYTKVRNAQRNGDKVTIRIVDITS